MLVRLAWFIILNVTIVLILHVMSGHHEEHRNSILGAQGHKSNKRLQRLPDALIMGVKKCGTTTLGLDLNHQNKSTHFFSDRFLSYHPSLRVKGEISFVKRSSNIMKMMPLAYENETVLVKSKGKGSFIMINSRLQDAALPPPCLDCKI